MHRKPVDTRGKHMDMTPTRPYLVRAIYEWIIDNRCTPYLLLDAGVAGLRVPRQAIKDGRVLLNVAPHAVDRLDLGLDEIRFNARFSGVSQSIVAPTAAVLAIYAQENGQGMMFPAEDPGETTDEADSAESAQATDEGGQDIGDPPPAPVPERQRPSLRIVK